MSVATKSTLDHRGAEGKDWLVGPIAVGVPKCSFLFLVNSRKLNPGSLKYVFLYVYIYTLICISYVSICSIGTGWNDNVHLSGCVCVCYYDTYGRDWNRLHLKILKIISKRSNQTTRTQKQTLKSPWHVRVVTKWFFLRYFVTSDVGDGRIQWYAFCALPAGTRKAPQPRVTVDSWGLGPIFFLFPRMNFLMKHYFWFLKVEGCVICIFFPFWQDMTRPQKHVLTR